MTEPVIQSKEDKENVSQTCNLCKLSYTNEQDLKEHFWSLMHHMKIEEKKKNSLHNCTLCYATCSSISEYRKHLTGEKHQKAIEKYAEDCKKTKDNSAKQATNVPTNQSLREPEQDLTDSDNTFQFGNNNIRDSSWHNSDHSDDIYPFTTRNFLPNPDFLQRSYPPQPEYRRHYSKQWSKHGQFANRSNFEEHEYFEPQRDFPPYHFSGFRPRYSRDPLERPPRDFGKRHFEHPNDEYFKDFSPRDGYKRNSRQFSNERRDFNRYSQSGQIERPPRDFAKSNKWDHSSFHHSHPDYSDDTSFENPHWHDAQWDREPPPFYTYEEEMNYHHRNKRDSSGKKRMPSQAFGNQVKPDDAASRTKSFKNHEVAEGSDKNESREGSPVVSSSNPEPLEHSSGRKRSRDSEGESSASKASKKAEFISELRKRHASPANSPSRDFLKTSTDKNPFVELAHASLGFSENQLEAVSSDRCVSSSKDSAGQKVSSPVQRKRTVTPIRQRFGGKASPKNTASSSRFSPGKKSDKITEEEISENCHQTSSRNSVLETAEKLCRELREKRQNAQKTKNKLLLNQKQKALNSQIAVLTKTNKAYLKGHLDANEQILSPLTTLTENGDILGSSHSQNNDSNIEVVKISHSEEARISSLPLPSKSGIDKIRHEIESSVRGTKRFARSSCENNTQKEKTQEGTQHPKLTGRTLGKDKGPMSKDSLAKMVNAPRSRKERLQLAQIVRSHSKSQNKLAPSRLNIQLSGLYDNNSFDFDEEEMSEITLEDLSPQVKMQIAELIQNDIAEFDTADSSKSKTLPYKKHTAKQSSLDKLMDVDGDFNERPAKQEPVLDSRELTLADLVSPSPTPLETGAAVAESSQNRSGDFAVDQEISSEERTEHTTVNGHEQSSHTADPRPDLAVTSSEIRSTMTSSSTYHSSLHSTAPSGSLSDITLSSIISLSQREEEKQAELESVQMRMARLHNWLQQILSHLANFDNRQTKLQDEIRSLREERIQLINNTLASNSSSASLTTVAESDRTLNHCISGPRSMASLHMENSWINSVLENVTSSSVPGSSEHQNTIRASKPSFQQTAQQQFSNVSISSADVSAESFTPQNGATRAVICTSGTGLADYPSSQCTVSVSNDTDSLVVSAAKALSHNHDIQQHSVFSKPSSSIQIQQKSQIPSALTKQLLKQNSHSSVSQIAAASVAPLVQISPSFTCTNQVKACTALVSPIQRQSDLTGQMSGSLTSQNSEQKKKDFSSSSQKPASSDSLSSAQRQNKSGISHHKQSNSVHLVSLLDDVTLSKMKQKLNSDSATTSSSKDRARNSSETKVILQQPIKEERVTPPISDDVSSSAVAESNQDNKSDCFKHKSGNVKDVNAGMLKSSKSCTVSDGSRFENKTDSVLSERPILSSTGRRACRTLSESGNTETQMLSSHRLSETEVVPNSHEEVSVEKSTSLPVQYLGTITGDLDSADILKKVAANLGGLDHVNAVSYVYLNQKENIDVPKMVSSVCFDSSADSMVNSSSDFHMKDLDIGSNDNRTRHLTLREESDFGSIASNSSLGEKIKNYCQNDVKRTTLDTVEASQSDGDKMLEVEDGGQNSDNTPGKILKHCSVVLEKLEITNQHTEQQQDSVVMEAGSTSPSLRKKRKSKKERDLLANRKHKYWVDSSSSESASPDESKDQSLSSLKQQLVFSSKSDEDNSDESLKIKDDRNHEMKDHAKQTTKSEEENTDINPKRLKVKPEHVRPSGVDVDAASNDVDSSKNEMSFHGAQTPVSYFHVFQNELYIAYKGKENVKKFDITSGQCVMEYQGASGEYMVIGETKMDELPVKLFVGGTSEMLKVFDIRESKCIDSVSVKSAIQCMHACGTFVYLGLANGEVHVVKNKNNRIKDVFRCADKPIHSITTTKEAGRVLLCIAAQDSVISVCDAHSGLPIRILSGHRKTVFSVKASQDYVFSGSGDKTIMVHDLHTGDLEWTYSDHKGIVTSIWIYNDLLFSAGFDGLVRCFDIQKRTLKQMYYGAGKCSITYMAIYGNKLYTGNRKGEVECIELELDKNWSCRSPGCNYVFGLRDHLLHHILTDHTLPNTNMMRCPWKDCPQWISTENNTMVVEEHLRKHIDDTVLVIGDRPNLAAVIPSKYKL